MSYSVLVVDDHPLMASATKNLLEEVCVLKEVNIVRSGQEALVFIQKNQPHMIILDVSLPDVSGVEVAREVKQKWPHIKVIIFSGIDVTDYLPKLIEVKVNGAITKGVSHACFKSTLQLVMAGYVVLPGEFSNMPFSPSVSNFELTNDEVTILNMIVSGGTLDQIAEKIHISRRSVDNYQRRIYEKLGVKGRAQAVEAFVRSKYYQQQ